MILWYLDVVCKAVETFFYDFNFIFLRFSSLLSLSELKLKAVYYGSWFFYVPFWCSRAKFDQNADGLKMLFRVFI